MLRHTVGVNKTLATFALPGAEVALRRAMVEDVPGIVGLLAADPLGSSRESAATEADLSPYLRAFDAIDSDPAQLLLAAVRDKEVVGTLQLSFIPGLSRRGALRAQVEAVRVHQDYRGRGLGTLVFEWAIAEARRRACALVQLTADKTRADAHRFYESLGFVASHEGLKLQL